MTNPMVVYLAGPYRAKNGRTVREHVRTAEDWAVQVWKRGHFALCPHLNSAFMDGEAPDELFLAAGEEMVRRSDAILLLPHWTESYGSKRELAMATKNQLRVFHSYLDLP
jgi:hypothetical protein